MSNQLLQKSTVSARKSIIDSIVSEMTDDAYDEMGRAMRDVGVKYGDEVTEEVEELIDVLIGRVVEHSVLNAIDKSYDYQNMDEDDLLELATEFDDVDRIVANVPESVKQYNKLVKL